MVQARVLLLRRRVSPKETERNGEQVTVNGVQVHEVTYRFADRSKVLQIVA
jgi:hypothetical protein